MTVENFKISLPILHVLTPNFHSNSMQRMASMDRFNDAGVSHTVTAKQEFLTLQNHHCKNQPSHFFRISYFSRILFISSRLEFDQVIL